MHVSVLVLVWSNFYPILEPDSEVHVFWQCLAMRRVSMRMLATCAKAVALS
ncbi:MAG: hypothetical protein FD152_2722, partial [Xanthobacteraceae bacterium]